MPQSGLWRKKLLAGTVRAAIPRQWQDFRLPPTSEAGRRRVLNFPRQLSPSQGVRFPHDGADAPSHGPNPDFSNKYEKSGLRRKRPASGLDAAPKPEQDAG